MKMENVLEYVEYALKCAECKCDTLEEAKDISQEVLLQMLLSIEAGRDIENPKAWISSVVNHKHADFLRRKYRNPVTYMEVEYEQVADSISDRLEDIIKSEEYMQIRKQIAYTAKLYREVIVRYYINNQKVKQIAEDLDISVNTVKSRLDAGRKHIRKGMDMDNGIYVKQSMEPDDLWLSIAGRCGDNWEPFEGIYWDKIAMNILILAYEKPIDISELSKKIGIACAYIEPIINKLLNAQLMKKISNKVYTDFVIYSCVDRLKTYDLEKECAEKIAKSAIDTVKKHFADINDSIKKRLTENQRNSLFAYFAVKALLNSLWIIRDEKFGKVPFEEYPERPNNGKWYACGYHYPAGYDYENDKRKKYNISGESDNELVSKDNNHRLSVFEFDTTLGETRKYWHKLSDKMNAVEFLKLMYVCDTKSEEKLFHRYGVTIENKTMENIDALIDGGFITKDRELNIPMLDKAEFENVLEHIKKCEVELVEKFEDIYVEICKQGEVGIPSHMTQIPGFRRTANCYSLPMMIIFKAKEEGWILKGVEGNVPAVIMMEK